MAAVWPFWPESPLLEALEWLTDVQTARSGVESRLSLRSGPRLTLEMDYNLRTPAGQGRFEALSYTSQDQECLVPWWPGQRPAGTLAAGTVELALDTEGAGFAAPGQALVIQNAEAWEVVPLAAVAEGGLTLAAPLSGAYARAWVAPLLSCRMALSFTRQDLPTGRSLGRAVFTADAPETPDPGTADMLWQGFEIWPQALWCGPDGLEREGSRAAEDLDNATGRVHRVVYSESTASTAALRLRARNKAEAVALRRFLHRCAGRLTPFWLPTARQDLVLAQDVGEGGLVLRCQAASSVQALVSPARRALALRLPDGGVIFREVVSAGAVSGGFEDITVAEALPALTAGTVRLSWLCLARLDADRVELSWERAGCCTVEVKAKEIWR